MRQSDIRRGQRRAYRCAAGELIAYDHQRSKEMAEITAAPGRELIYLDFGGGVVSASPMLGSCRRVRPGQIE